MPELLGTSDDLKVTRDADSAIIVQTEESSVDIPKDPEEGITLGLEDGTELNIELPNSDEAKNAKRVAPGVVAYPANDGSANAVQADESGGVRMLTIIDNADAPTEYEYKVTVPDGRRIELTEDGGAVVRDLEGQPLAVVEIPWAKDALDTPIQTWFTTDGTSLTQHVAHTVEGTAYPVVADPAWLVGVGAAVAGL